MDLIAAVQRLWAHRRLNRGRCRCCRTILADYNQGPYCSTACADEYEQRHAW